MTLRNSSIGLSGLFLLSFVFQNCANPLEFGASSVDSPASTSTDGGPDTSHPVVCGSRADGEIWSAPNGSMDESTSCPSGQTGSIANRYIRLEARTCRNGLVVSLNQFSRGDLLSSLSQCNLIPTGASCASATFSVPTDNNGVCTGTLPPSPSSPYKIQGVGPVGKTGPACLIGDVQGSHTGVLTGLPYGTCNSYCSILAICNNGTWTRVGYTW